MCSVERYPVQPVILIHWAGAEGYLIEILTSRLPFVTCRVSLSTNMLQLWKASGPSARVVLLGMFAQDCEGRGSLYQKTKFRYGLYEFALLR